MFGLDSFELSVSKMQDGLGLTWTPKLCKIMAFMAVIMGLGLLFYILFGVWVGLNLGLRVEGLGDDSMALGLR